MATSVRDLLRYDGELPAPRATPGVKSKAAARKDVAALAPELAQLQERLFANGKVDERTRALLLLQGTDTSGKDGTVKHVVGLVNPSGCRITSFGKPTKEELAHDFLWRITDALPGPGQLGVFNRSQYEDVLVVRVHELVPRAVWSRRYAQINAWERRLVRAGTPVLKVFLHISRKEQKERLLARLQDPTKHWKVGTNDIPERHLWDAYQEAYDAVLEKCSTDGAPWYVVPADRKWYRDWAVTQLLTETLRDLRLEWPTPAGVDLAAMVAELEAE
jgi:PPK2 family polyphosphate:nucleotide phosphotransferase